MNLKRVTGLNREIQEHIMHDHRFALLVQEIISEVNEKGYSRISISCKRGKHRSVAVAELLKRFVYPNADVIHTNL